MSTGADASQERKRYNADNTSNRKRQKSELIRNYDGNALGTKAPYCKIFWETTFCPTSFSIFIVHCFLES